MQDLLWWQIVAIFYIKYCFANEGLYKIEGKVLIPFVSEIDWLVDTKILFNGDEYISFLRNDGSFSTFLPGGTYSIEVANPFYSFESARIDINSKGKIRVRRLNYLQPSAVLPLPYPLKFKAKGKTNYFHQREQWRITDFLFSPMVLTMFLPLILLMILPKLINAQDPETQKEMQQTMGLLNPKQSLPELSEVFTKIFGSGSAKKINKNKNLKKRA